MRRFLLWVPIRFPEWMLRMHKDHVGRRTWATFLGFVHVGWKLGETFDRLHVGGRMVWAKR
jgi:hypothetical protein